MQVGQGGASAVSFLYSCMSGDGSLSYGRDIEDLRRNGVRMFNAVRKSLKLRDAG